MNARAAQRLLTALLPLSLLACSNAAPDPDSDHDGFPLSTDCNDGDPSIHPGATDVCYDAVDQDCNLSDEQDCDHDGSRSQTMGGLDCDDAAASVHPGAQEVPYDGVDQDCDGEDLTDRDEDGFAATKAGGVDCDDDQEEVHPGADESPYDGVDQDCSGRDLTDVDEDGSDAAEVNGADCDDQNPSIGPEQAELPDDGIDQDCDNQDLRSDIDGDGVTGPQVGGPDCNDQDPAISPLEPEVAGDGVDQNCDGNDDIDADGDGALSGEDCNDLDSTVGPHLSEVPGNSVDEDCDGVVSDADGDGVPAPSDCDDGAASIHPYQIELACNAVDENCDGRLLDQDCDQVDAVADGGTDCAPTNPAIHPDALEVMNGADDDCDGAVDEAGVTAEARAELTSSDAERLGQAVAVGDVTGDGLLDVVVGAPGHQDSGGSATGAVWILPGSLDDSVAPVLIAGTAVDGETGAALAVGDVDLDGVDDVLVGSPGAGVNGAGAVSLFLGGGMGCEPSCSLDDATATWVGRGSQAGMGTGVAIAKRETAPPLLVLGMPGAAGGAGEVWVIPGQVDEAGGVVWGTTWTVAGEDPGDRLGDAVSSVADLNGDGLDELALTASGVELAYLVSGARSEEGLQVVSTLGLPSGSVPGPVVGVGDVNGDGLRDVAVGAPAADPEEVGKVVLVMGKQSWPATLDLDFQGSVVFYGEGPGDGFGTAVAAGPAVGGNLPGLVVGATRGEDGCGRVFLYGGQPGQSWGPQNVSAALSSWTGLGGGLSGGGLVVGRDESQWSQLVVGGPRATTCQPEGSAALVFAWR